MPRTMTDNMASAIASPNTRPAIFVQMNFSSGPVYIWSGVGNMAWNGFTWTGLGALLSFAMAEDSAVVEARGISITMNGLDATLLPDCMADFQLGLPVIVYLGLCWTDRSYNNILLIDSPLTAWSGRMDKPDIDVDGETAKISIACETRLIDMNVPATFLLTQEQQQADFPNDVGCQFILGLQENLLYWGKYPVSGANL